MWRANDRGTDSNAINRHISKWIAVNETTNLRKESAEIVYSANKIRNKDSDIFFIDIDEHVFSVSYT